MVLGTDLPRTVRRGSGRGQGHLSDHHPSLFSSPSAEVSILPRESQRFLLRMSSSSVFEIEGIEGSPQHNCTKLDGLGVSVQEQAARDEHRRSLWDSCQPSSAFEQQIAMRLRTFENDGEDHDLITLTSALLGLGYQVQVRAGDEHRAGQDILTKLRHRFLTCTGFHHHSSDFDHRTFLAEPLVIEPRFRDQFEVADLDEEYEALLEMVPPHFVGTPAKLHRAVSILSSEMARSFRRANRSLPPWRTKQAMMSRWAPEQLAELTSLLAQSDGLHHTSDQERPDTSQLPGISKLEDTRETVIKQHEASIKAQVKSSLAPSLVREPLNSLLLSAIGVPSDAGGRCEVRANLPFTRLPSSDLRMQVKECKLRTKSALATALSVPPVKSITGANPFHQAGDVVKPVGLKTLLDSSSGMRINTVKWGSATLGRPS